MTDCFHNPKFHKPGPRIPLRYGSGDTVICGQCGMWKVWTIGGPPSAYWHQPPVRTEPPEDDA